MEGKVTAESVGLSATISTRTSCSSSLRSSSHLKMASQARYSLLTGFKHFITPSGRPGLVYLLTHLSRTSMTSTFIGIPKFIKPARRESTST